MFGIMFFLAVLEDLQWGRNVVILPDHVAVAEDDHAPDSDAPSSEQWYANNSSNVDRYLKRKRFLFG